MINKLLEKIKQYNNIVIYRHLRPDGDAIGSSQGLKEIIRTSYPKKNVYNNAIDNSDYLDFVTDLDNFNEENFEDDFLAIIVDTAVESRISGEGYKRAKEVFKIDHHNDGTKYGDYMWIDVECPACAAMITKFLMTFKEELKISEKGALYLFMGIVTDTGRFKYRGVNSSVMKGASHLLQYNIDLQALYANLYVRSADEFKAQAFVYKSFKQTKNGVSYLYFSQRNQKKLGLTIEQASSYVNSFENIKGSLIWILFLEQEDKQIRTRLRSRFITINDIANVFGGGGHHQASGAILKDQKEIKKLLDIADKKLAEFKRDEKDVF